MIPGGLGGISGLNIGSGNFGAGNIIAGLLFSTIGYLVFRHGKRESNVNLMLLGGALMTYCYFTPSTFWTVAVGLGLVAASRFMGD